MNQDYFPKIIGQTSVKRRLSFYIDGFRKTQVLPFLLFVGQKGGGKTRLAREMARSLVNPDGSTRPLLEINCASISSAKVFFQNTFAAYLSGSRATHILFDEAHMLPNDLVQGLLTICNSESDPVREYNYQESVLTFNFRLLTMMFCTTEPDRLFAPFKDRLTPVELEEYSVPELGEIVQVHCPKISFERGVLDDIASTLRGNPRNCVLRAKDIKMVVGDKGQFSRGDWKSMKFNLGILPSGISTSELNVLRLLMDRGPTTLQNLSASTGFSRQALQKDIENFLLRKGFMMIDGKRMITAAGAEILKEANEG